MPKRLLVASLLITLNVTAAFAATCESLTSLKLPDTTVTSAVTVPSGDLHATQRAAERMMIRW